MPEIEVLTLMLSLARACRPLCGGDIFASTAQLDDFIKSIESKILDARERNT